MNPITERRPGLPLVNVVKLDVLPLKLLQDTVENRPILSIKADRNASLRFSDHNTEDACVLRESLVPPVKRVVNLESTRPDLLHVTPRYLSTCRLVSPIQSNP